MPLPVGPVRSIMPKGFLTIFFNIDRVSCMGVNSSSLRMRALLFRSRMTTFSPNMVGNVETRISMSLFPIFMLNLPSCGSLFSAIFRFPSIFTLDATAGCSLRERFDISCRTPSILILTRNVSSSGSMWISLALSITDWEIIRFTSWITDASLAILSSFSGTSSSPLRSSISVPSRRFAISFKEPVMP